MPATPFQTSRHALPSTLRFIAWRRTFVRGLVSVLGLAALTLVAIPQLSAAATLQPPKLPGLQGTWNLSFDSEFTGPRLDTTEWQPGWFGWGTSGPINSTTEKACYSSRNIALVKGAAYMNLTATPAHCAGQTLPYTGSILSSNPKGRKDGGGFQFTYGLVEARVYVPAKGGQLADWPAIETFGQHWPNDGEDDILEVLDGQACYRFHSLANVVVGNGNCLTRFHSGWNLIAANWEPGSVTYYYNGVQVGHVASGVTNAPMYLILVNTVSAKYPQRWKPDTVRVDWVRVWQKA